MTGIYKFRPCRLLDISFYFRKGKIGSLLCRAVPVIRLTIILVCQYGIFHHMGNRPKHLRNIITTLASLNATFCGNRKCYLPQNLESLSIVIAYAMKHHIMKSHKSVRTSIVSKVLPKMVHFFVTWALMFC